MYDDNDDVASLNVLLMTPETNELVGDCPYCHIPKYKWESEAEHWHCPGCHYDFPRDGSEPIAPSEEAETPGPVVDEPNWPVEVDEEKANWPGGRPEEDEDTPGPVEGMEDDDEGFEYGGESPEHFVSDAVLRETIEDFGDVGDFEQPQSHLYVLRYTIYPSRGEFQPKTKIFKFRARDTLGALKKTLYELFDYDTPWKDFLEELPEICGGDISEENLKAVIESNAEGFNVDSLRDETGKLIFTTSGAQNDEEAEEDYTLDESVESAEDFGDVGEFEEPPIHPLAEGLRNVWVNVLESLWKEFGGEGSDDEVFDFVHEAEKAGVSTELLKDFLGNIFGNADEATLQYWVGEDDEDTEFNENSYSFYGVESYLLPKG